MAYIKRIHLKSKLLLLLLQLLHCFNFILCFAFLFCLVIFLYQNFNFDVPFSKNYFYNDPNKENLIFLLNSILPVFLTEPKPEIEYFHLNNTNQIPKIRSDLLKKSGIYGFINNIDGKRYIGSGVDLYRRFLDHLKGRRSNIRLQRAIKAHGIDNFSFVVYAFAENTMPTITIMETLFMSYFPKEFLYNFKYKASSKSGYKPTEEAIANFKKRFLDPNNHPMFGKTHYLKSKSLIRKPVTLYDVNNNNILTFKSSVQLSEYLRCAKSTVLKYIKSGKLYKGIFFIKKD